MKWESYDFKSWEVQHIEIREKGIFVIETKNISGYIKGGIDDSKWTASSVYSTKKIFNPLKQNERHIKVLDFILRKNLKKDFPIYSLVVFVSNNAKNLKIDNVINATHLRFYLNGFKSDKTITIDEMNEIKRVIDENNKRDTISVIIQNKKVVNAKG